MTINYIQKSLNLIDHKIEYITSTNINDYIDLIDSIKYICNYSGYDPESINSLDEIENPQLPPGGNKNNNYILGIKNLSNDDSVCWIQFKKNFELKQIFIGEFYIKKSVQNHGLGKLMLSIFEENWIQDGIKDVILNVDLKNWQGLRFWIRNKYTNIQDISGDKEYSEHTFGILRLRKYLVR